jgi:hypothetical protein
MSHNRLLPITAGDALEAMLAVVWPFRKRATQAARIDRLQIVQEGETTTLVSVVVLDPVGHALPVRAVEAARYALDHVKFSTFTAIARVDREQANPPRLYIDVLYDAGRRQPGDWSKAEPELMVALQALNQALASELPSPWSFGDP